MSNYNFSLNDIIWSTTETNNIIFYLQKYIIFITRINLKNGVFNAYKKQVFCTNSLTNLPNEKDAPNDIYCAIIS